MLPQKLILSYISRIFVQIIQILATIIVARIAGPGVLGNIAFGLAYVSMFSFVADLGFGTAHIKMLSEGKDEATCIGTFARIKLILTFLYVISVIGFFSIQKYIFNASFESKDHIYVIFISLAAATFNQIFSIAKTTFAAYTQQAKSDLPEFIQILILQIFRIVIVLLGFRAVALAFGNLFSTILLIPVFAYLIKNYKVGPYNGELAKEYKKIALPVMLTAFTATVYTSIDKVLLQFLTNSEQVGFYTAGFRIGGFVLLIAQSIGLLFYPIFSKAASQKDFVAIKRQIEKFERFSFVYIMPFLILVTLFAGEIVNILLGKQYISSIPIMMIINVAMFLKVTYSPYGSLIVGLGYFKKGLVIGVFQFAFYLIILLILLHPLLFKLEGIGAAFAILLSELFLLILYRMYAKKYMPILSIRPMIISMSYGIINYLAFFLILNKTTVFAGYFKLLFILVYLLATYFSMFLCKLADKNDWYYLHTLFNYKAMGRYIKTELRS